MDKMSITEQEAMNPCHEGVDKCEECPRLGDDCDGNEEYWDRTGID